MGDTGFRATAREAVDASPAGVATALAVVLLLVHALVGRPGLFVDQLVGGLVYGLILVLVALGLSIILGLLGVVNFAHGAFFMVGAYLTFQVVAAWGLPFWAALVVVPVLVGLAGVVIERGVLRYVYDENPLIGLLATFGLALMIDEATRAIWGGSPLSVPTPAVLDSSVDIGVTSIARMRLFTVVVGVVVIVGIYLLIERTDFGLSVRAGVLDREMAEFVGVNIPLRFVVMFFLGAAIAGLGGVLRGAELGMDLGMGNQFIILAFVVVVVGGVGSLFGSVAAGILIGEATFLTPLVLATLADSLNAVSAAVPWESLTMGAITTMNFDFVSISGIGGLMPYLVMIVVLLVRPRGLFGQEGFME